MRSQHRSRTATRRCPGAILLAVAGCLLLPRLALAQGGRANEKVLEARTALEEWVETRRIISQEKRDWALGRELLQDRIDVVKREIESLRTRISDAEKSLGEAETKKAELVASKEQLVQSSSALSGIVAALETRARELLPRLPGPLREQVLPISQLIPEKPEESKASLGHRFLSVVGLLNEVDRFNREITVTSEVRPLGDGNTAEVTAMYVGLGQGYYVTARGDAAGVGTATEEGWVWIPANESAAAIKRAIAIHKNEDVADFVRLPVHIK